MSVVQGPLRARMIAVYLVTGALAGLCSGLFGVGGGTVIVPALVLLGGFQQRAAAGTSSAAIFPAAVVGLVSYAIAGEVDWLAGVLIALGAVAGAQVGVRLLHVLSEIVLRWIFIVFLVAVAVSLFIVIPSREAELQMSGLVALGLVALGLVTGVISGLVGVGGGIVVVPVLILLFGTSDLVAKGTSLLMMIPTAVSSTIANVRKNNVNVTAAVTIGGAACVFAPLGTTLAIALDPQVANILFAIFITITAAQLALRAIRRPRPEAPEVAQ